MRNGSSQILASSKNKPEEYRSSQTLASFKNARHLKSFLSSTYLLACDRPIDSFDISNLVIESPTLSIRKMAPSNGRIVVAPGAPQHILDMCRSAAQTSKTAALSGRYKMDSLPKNLVAPKAPRRPHTEQKGRRRRRQEPKEPKDIIRSTSASSIGTLFSGERVGGHLPRGSAVIFRRPHRSKVPPHQRPIFLVKENGVDPKDCMDIHNPKRFSSIERSMALRGIRHLNPLPSSALPSAPSSRPNSVASCSSPIPDYPVMPAFRPMSQCT